MVTLIKNKKCITVRKSIITYLLCHKALEPIGFIAENVMIGRFNNELYFIGEETRS